MSLANVRVVVTDVDGVLTDDTFMYGHDRQKYRRWNHADGQAALKLRAAGIDTLFLTQEESPDIELRASALGVKCIVGGTDKLEALQRLYLSPWEISLANVAYIGNEENDLQVLLAVGHPFLPADAWLEAFKHEVGGYQLARKGGDGCLREVAERILQYRNAEVRQ